MALAMTLVRSLMRVPVRAGWFGPPWPGAREGAAVGRLSDRLGVGAEVRRGREGTSAHRRAGGSPPRPHHSDTVSLINLPGHDVVVLIQHTRLDTIPLMQNIRPNMVSLIHYIRPETVFFCHNSQDLIQFP